MKQLFIYLSVIFIVKNATAGGFKIALQGQKAQGIAHIGAGYAQDASTVYFNPAGMAFVNNSVNFGVTYLMPRTQFVDASTQLTTNANVKNFTPFSLFTQYSIKPKLKVGLGIYTPFGSGISYPNNWTGQYILNSIELQAIFIQPTLSYLITNNISIGLGGIYSTGNFTLSKNIPIQSQSNNNVGNAALRANAAGQSFTSGVFYNKNKVTAGIVYRGALTMQAKNGTATFTNIPSSLIDTFPNTTFTTELPLPAEIAIGGSYKINNKFTIAGEYNFTFWKTFDSLGFDYTKNTTKLTDEKQPRLYNNSSTFRIGIVYNYNRKTTIRGGIFLDNTPVNKNLVNPDLPDNNKVGFSLGASYNVNKKWTIDASALYENVPARLTTNTYSNLQGTYATKVFALGLGANYNFNTKSKK